MSGTSRQFQAVITVNDRTAAPLALISARLRAIAGMSGMERIRASALGVQRSFGAMAGSMTRLAAVAGGIGAAAGVGLVATMNAAVEAGGALSDLSGRLGMSVEDIQAFGFAFEQAGVNSEQFTGAVERLNRGIGEVAAGKNEELAALFRRLGISVRDSSGQIRSAASIMPQIAQAFERNENGALRTRMAMAIFGRAGGPLITALAQGANGLREQTDRWRELDGQITGQSVGALDDVGDGMNEVRHSLLGVRNAIAVQLAPVLAPLFAELATWIAANRDLIASNVGQWVRDLAEWIKGIDFAAIIEQTRGFITAAGELFDKIGGWKTIGIATAAYFTGPFIASLAVLALAISSTLIPPLVRAVGLMAQLGGAGAAGALARLAPAAASLAPAAAPAAAALAPAAAAAAPAAAAATPMAAAAGAAASAAVAAAGLAAAGLAVAQVITAAEDPEIRRQSRERLDAGANGARRIEGFDTPDDGEAAPPRASWLSRLPSLFGRQQDQRSAAEPARGQVDVRMRFENVPPGARVDAQASGAGVQQPELDVGYATMGAY